MPSLQVTNGGLLKLVWNRAGVPFMVNVLGLSGTSAAPVTKAKVDLLAAAVASSITSSGLGAQQHPTISLGQITVRDINIENALEITGAFTPVTPTGTGNFLPPQIALVATMRTAKAGPRFRGRVYIAGFSAFALDTQGTATIPCRDAVGAFVNAIASALVAQSWKPAVISRPVYQKPIAVPPVLIRAGVATDVTGIDMRDVVFDTQRRRSHPGI